jgi:glycosyltransferase involved in cell wall biosynthesis
MFHNFKRIYSLLVPEKQTVIGLEPAGKPRGCVVISYITWPFVEGFDSPKARGHTNAYEVIVMAEAYRDLGFRVEVVDWDHATYAPPADCRIAIDIHSNLERWQDALPANCKRILHATGPHWLFWNHAELSRLQAVRDRKGIALRPRRGVPPSRGVEAADHVVVLGNEFTRQTFLFGGRPVTRIPISSAYEFPWPERRDFELARRKFLWVGSYGMVHKGLDLALDAFAEMPDLELTVCGRPEKEEDFYRLYGNLLLKTPNIRLHGWLDMASPDFIEIARTHAAVIYPSSAEGGAGSVIHCMHAGLLPACTREASIDLGDFGVGIHEGSVEAVRMAARTIAEMSPREVEDRSRKAWEHVRRVHTREQFRNNYRAFAEQIAGSL